jgi:hypothetical protein
MMHIKRKLLAATILATGMVAIGAQAEAALVITTSSDANALIGALVGPGITVTGGQSYVPAGTDASGGFTGGGGNTGIGFASGVILTTGDANDAPGPNNADNTTTVNGAPGDADLDALIPGFSTQDATILQFDFQFGDGSTGGDLFFNYQFASEEYNEFVNSSFNDVFGLFVDGTNVAKAGNGDAVSINNVNCGNPFSGAGPNCNQYQNNDPNDPGPATLDIEYDGLTTVLQAQALGLGPGTHTLKLAIADAGDSNLDSALFIQGGSITDTPTPTPTPEPGTLVLLGSGLLGLGFLARRRRSAS